MRQLKGVQAANAFFNDLGYVSSADWQLEKFPRTLQKRLATPRNRSDPLPEIWHSEVCPASAEQNERPPCRSVKHWLERIFKVAMRGPSSNQPCFEQKRRWDMVFVTTWETFPASKFQLEKFPRSLQKRRCLYFVTAGQRQRAVQHDRPLQAKTNSQRGSPPRLQYLVASHFGSRYVGAISIHLRSHLEWQT